tara:strand:+ start:228 stop:434 length:207 start_codon:yes stop_codon:yes gene_type:complete
MVNTIEVSQEMKEMFDSFGDESESDQTKMERVMNMAIETQIREHLTSDENTISIEEARKELDREWPRS